MSNNMDNIALFDSIPDSGPYYNNSLQYGENGNAEYKWSTYFKEKIVQLSFQLTRTHDPTQKIMLGTKYGELLQEAFLSSQLDTITRGTYISILHKLMLHTRDIIDGKGEYSLFYTLFAEWIKFSEQLKRFFGEKYKDNINCIEQFTNKAVETLVYLEDNDHPYGSWKDMKYLLNYLRTRKDITSHVYHLPIFKHIIEIIVKQLATDACGLRKPSLLAKWLPREKSKKFGWIAKHIACQYYSHWLITSDSSITAKDKTRVILSNKYSERKCLTHYRQLIASINRSLKTVQINQCNHSWQDIDFEKGVTSITMSRQKTAFQYKNKRGECKGLEQDRLLCKENYQTYIKKCMEGDITIKGKRVGIIEIVRDALEIVDLELNMKKFASSIDDTHKTTKDTINLQWRESANLKKLENCIPLIDTSGSMEGEPLLAALGLGCRIAENSRLGKRAITFSAKPSWVDLSDCDTIIEMVHKLSTNKDWGMNTNIVSAMELLSEACIEKGITVEEVANLTLVIFSDMQIDQADKDSSTMQSVIEKIFYDAGLRSKYATPFKTPRIIYWNLRSTTGFPALSFMNNINMISGFSQIIMNSLCEKGIDGLKDCTPWELLNLQLSNKRYSWVDETLKTCDMLKNYDIVNEPPENISNGWFW